MKKLFLALTSAVLMAASFACSSSDQEKAKVEIKDDAQKTTAEAKKAGAEIKQDAKDLSRKVGCGSETGQRECLGQNVGGWRPG